MPLSRYVRSAPPASATPGSSRTSTRDGSLGFWAERRSGGPISQPDPPHRLLEQSNRCLWWAQHLSQRPPAHLHRRCAQPPTIVCWTRGVPPTQPRPPLLDCSNRGPLVETSGLLW